MIVASVHWPEIVEATATAVGSIGVVAALTYTARQTHALRNQANLQRDEAERNVEVQTGEPRGAAHRAYDFTRQAFSRSPSSKTVFL